MTQREIKKFQNEIKRHYQKAGRDLPWRRTIDPYKILVSEIMLQQTQVDRVVPKYQAFLKRFSSAKKLAAARLVDVLRLWQGLGYNRRAKFLREAATQVIQTHKGKFPNSESELLKLPGIGKYTAAAVAVFAFNQPAVMIETNIRQVYLHHFFKNKIDVDDKDIMLLIERTLDKTEPRKWYWALMDYGSYLKKTHGNSNMRSRHYNKQTKFIGSDRQVRGRVIALLSVADKASFDAVLNHIAVDAGRVAKILESLIKDGMIRKTGGVYRIA